MELLQQYQQPLNTLEKCQDGSEPTPPKWKVKDDLL